MEDGQGRRNVLTDTEAEQAGQFFQEHYRFIENVARHHAPSPDDVPDIVQVVGIKVCRNLHAFRGESSPTTWLYRVTVNAARDYFRSESRTRRAKDALTATPPPEPILDPDHVVTQGERTAALKEAVARLGENHRLAIMDVLQPGPVITSRRSKSTRHAARRRLADMLTGDPRLQD